MDELRRSGKNTGFVAEGKVVRSAPMGKCGFNPSEALNPQLTSAINLLSSHRTAEPWFALCALPRTRGCQIGADKLNNESGFMYRGV